MKLEIKDLTGASRGEYNFRVSLIENGKGSQAVHDVVVAYRAAQRSGTACTKTMGEVAGSGKKPWRQKGTGRARAGSFQSPLWVGGGVVFGPKPRSFRKTVSRSTRQLALRKALSARLQANDVVVVDEFKLTAPKTKEFVKALAALGIHGTALVVSAAADKNFLLAGRNLPGVELATADTVHTYQLLKSDKVVFTRDALARLEARIEDSETRNS